MPVAARMARGPVLMAVLFTAGMLFTQTDFMASPQSEYLPQVYVGSAQHGQSNAGFEVMPGNALMGGNGRGTGRGTGRVLLSTDEGFREGFGEQEGATPVSDLSRQEVLIVTLLDHLAATHGSPTLLPRLCNRLHEMGVVSSCNFQQGIEEVRRRFLAEFWAFRKEFFSTHSEGDGSTFESFTFTPTHEQQEMGSDLSPRFTQHQIASALPKLPLFPLAPIAKRSTEGLGLHSDLNFLCPSAQLLIADRPANPPSSSSPSVPSVPDTTDADGWRHVPVVEEDAEEAADDESGEWKPTLLSDGYTVSMMLPRESLEGVHMVGSHLELPEGGSRMVEFRCKAFDLHPFSSPSLLSSA
mmetsp:Transcript_34643/g.71504  ORF Transcript_34643/g.71504 Transcript_34643/m.71504 type:complete len:355 (-) Transcript_34643:671-1735(-)